MQSWEAKVILGAEHITQVILPVRGLPNSSATASKLVDYYRLCTCGGKVTAEPFFKLEGSTIMQDLLRQLLIKQASMHSRTYSHTHITNRNYKAETHRREKVRERLSERI